MKKQMKRTVYEAPVTERFQVELEGSFCGSVIDDQGQGAGVTSGSQGYDEFTGNAGFEARKDDDGNDLGIWY